MYDDVLLPTDGSDGTRRAIGHALALATHHDATVHALAVVNDGGYRSLDSETVAAEAERAARRAVRHVETRASREGVDVVTATSRGVPSEEILAYADEHGIDAIVMGTHGRTGLDRLLVGSVTEQVVRAAAVPVVTVRMDDELSITTSEEANSIAREALADRGYDSIAIREEPYRTSASWIVVAESDAGTHHVHVDAVRGDARVATVDL